MKTSRIESYLPFVALLLIGIGFAALRHSPGYKHPEARQVCAMLVVLEEENGVNKPGTAEKRLEDCTSILEVQWMFLKESGHADLIDEEAQCVINSLTLESANECYVKEAIRLAARSTKPK